MIGTYANSFYLYSNFKVAANVPHTPEEPNEVNEML